MKKDVFKLTAAQQEKAIGLRDLLTAQRPDTEGAWEAFIDFSRALGRILDGLDVIVDPTGMKPSFDAAWKAYVKLWALENERLINEALGGDGVLLEHVKAHPNGQNVVRRILDRVREQHGGIRPGVDATSVKITDILVEEMPDLRYDGN